MPKLSANPTVEGRRGREFEVGSLPLGSYFDSYDCQGLLVVKGFLMDVTPGRAIVVLTDEGDGNFQGEGDDLRRICRLEGEHTWSLESPVGWLGVDDEVQAAIYEAKRQHGEEQRHRIEERVRQDLERQQEERTMALPADPRQRATIFRWNFQCADLRKAVEIGDSGRIEAVRRKINEVAVEAESLGILSLPAPPEEVAGDEVFAGLEEMLVPTPEQARSRNLGMSVGHVVAATQRGGSNFGGGTEVVRSLTSIPRGQLVDGDLERVRPGGRYMALGQKAGTSGTTNGAEAVAAAGQAVSKPSKAEQLKAANAARKASLAAKSGKADGAAGAAKTPKVAKVKTLGPCLDGCGAEVSSRFAVGHDAKLKSLLLKVERGEVDQKEIPEVAQGYIKLKKGEVEISKVGDVTTKTQLYVVTQAPVRFAGRPEVAFVEKLDDGR